MNIKRNEEKIKKEFYRHLREAIKAALSYLKKKVTEEPTPILRDYDIMVDFNGRWWNIVRRRSYSLSKFVEGHAKEILKIQPIIQCLDFMMKHEFYKMLGEETGNNRKNISNIEFYRQFLADEIIIFLTRYVESKGDSEFDDEIFNKLYQELEEYIYTEGRDMIIVIPLLNFELRDVEIVDLKDFAIRRLTEDEIKILLRSGNLGGFSFLPHGGSIQTIWGIEFRMKLPNRRRIKDPTPQAEKIITALRLYKRGTLSYSTMVGYPTKWRTSKGILFLNYDYIRGVAPSPYCYEFGEGDIKGFQALWDRFKKVDVKERPSLSVAIRRFNFSYNKK